MGAGKSSLLAALLGEMYSKGGTVTVAGSTGYAAQDPWIQNATLRDNILMGSEFNQARCDRYLSLTLRKLQSLLPAGSTSSLPDLLLVFAD